MIRRIVAGLLFALLTTAPCLAQLSNAQLLSLIAANVPSGQPGVLTANSLRAVLNAMVNSTEVASGSCPASTAISKYQPFANTTSSPTGTVLSVYDGTSCIPWALFNETTHTLTIAGTAANDPGQNIIGRFGSMDVCQRGAGASCSIGLNASTTAYTVDGCYLTTGANEGSTMTLQGGLTAGSNKSATVARNAGQTGTAQITFGCPLDSDEIALARQSFVTLSFYTLAGANWSPVSGAITANVLCGTGTPVKQTVGYTNQVSVLTLSQNLTPGGAVTRLQTTSAATVPSNCTQMEVQWTWSPTGTAGAADLVAIDQVQLETVSGPTAVASPFQQIDFGTQLAMARRHYFKTFLYGTAPVQNAGANTAELVGQSMVGAGVGFDLIGRFPVQMRVTPSITTFNPQAANAQMRNETLGSDGSATGTFNITTESFATFATTPTSTAAGNTFGIHITADAGI